jgi:hypothetical protein
MKILKNLGLVLCTGYVFVYFSEHLFWAHFREGDTPQDWLGTWVAYSLAAFLFLVILEYFRVKDKWTLFLAGSMVGWLTEGVVVQTAYEMLPLSISFTGLAWHALITVWVGWYAIQNALASGRPWTVVKLAGLIGLLQGLWAISWWIEPDGRISPLPEYALFIFGTTALAVLAYRLAGRWSPSLFKWNRWVLLSVIILFALWFFLVAVPARPIALLILPILLGLTIWGLLRNRANESEGSLLDSLPRLAPLRCYMALFALPAASTLVYALALWLDLRLRTNWVLYLVTTPLGFILFGISLVKSLKKCPAAESVG